MIFPTYFYSIKRALQAKTIMPKKFDFAENFSKYFRKFKKLIVKNLHKFLLEYFGKVAKDRVKNCTIPQSRESSTALSHKAWSQVLRSSLKARSKILHFPTKDRVKYYAVPWKHGVKYCTFPQRTESSTTQFPESTE